MTAKLALISCDLQNEAVLPDGKFGGPDLFGNVGIVSEVNRKGVLGNVKSTLERARAAGLTIIHVGTQYRSGYPEIGTGYPVFDMVKSLGTYLEGSWGVGFPEEVAPKGDEPIVMKRKMNAFFESDLELILRTQDTDTIVIFGVALNNVVESTARQAADMGYNVIILEDCCASFDGEQEAFSLKRFLPRIGRVMQSEDFFNEIAV